MRSNVRLAYFAGGLLILNIVAAAVAIVLNWPAQFGGVGTDAASEFLTRGTAVSAPLAPLVVILLTAVCAARRDRWGWVGVVAAVVTAPVILVGGVGELVAAGTADTPKEVLVASGTVAAVLAVLYLAQAIAAAMERSRFAKARSAQRA